MSDPADTALDWLMSEAMAVDPDLRDHYFHICDGQAFGCGCKYEGES